MKSINDLNNTSNNTINTSTNTSTNTINQLVIDLLQQNNSELKSSIDDIKNHLFIHKIVSCCYYIYYKCNCNCNTFFNINDSPNVIYYKKITILRHLKQLDPIQQNIFNKNTHQHFTLDNFIIYLSSELPNEGISIDQNNIKYIEDWFN